MQKQQIVASYQNFHVIAHNLDQTGDLNAACKEKLGVGVRLADWNDLVAYHEAGGSLSDLIANLKIPVEVANSPQYRISMNGEPIWNGDRHYLLARHDHTKRAGFLAHSDIDNYHLTLGSWFGKGGFALCYGDPDSTVTPPIPEGTAPSRSVLLRSDENTAKPDTAKPVLTPVASYQAFHVVSHNLDETGDLNAACKEKLGVGVRLADWNDILAYLREGGSLKEFIDALEIPLEYENPKDVDPIPNTAYRISMNGELRWRGRHYFVARHDHTKREGFLSHSDIDNYHLTVGSWFGKGGFALCYGDLNGTVAPPEPEITKPVRTSGG